MFAAALSGIVFGVIGEGLVFSIGMMILKIRGVSIVMSGANITELLVGAVVGTSLWGAFGVAIGAVIPNQVGAVISLLAWGFVVENLVVGFLPKIGRFLPVHAEDAMMGHIDAKLLPGNVGSLVIIAWCVVLAGVEVISLQRRDVN